MKIYDLARLSDKEINDLCQRKSIVSENVRPIVKDILNKVKADGDEALLELTKQIDGVSLNSLKVSADEISAAKKRIPQDLAEAFNTAYSNLEKFHGAQLPDRVTVETMAGVTCFAETRPIEKVGLYVPGGTASLPSTALMLGIPAKLAGCSEVVLCTPPQQDGAVADSILYAADLCGIKDIYKVGGAQAIAAMAYGTETIPKVYKLFGPGNQYVTSAKMAVANEQGGPAIDMPAGPSEVMVIADQDSNSDFVAADLLSQAEHGVDSISVLVCTDQKKAQDIIARLEEQLSTLPRKEIAAKALENSFAVVIETLDAAIGFANSFASEHLVLGFDSADDFIDRVKNAGSVFIGPYSSESAGDYASGTNHSLPTYGYARAYSGVSVASFQKRITFQKVTKEGARNIGPTVSLMAAEESLEAHKRAMEIRL